MLGQFFIQRISKKADLHKKRKFSLVFTGSSSSIISGPQTRFLELIEMGYSLLLLNIFLLPFQIHVQHSFTRRNEIIFSFLNVQEVLLGCNVRPLYSLYCLPGENTSWCMIKQYSKTWGWWWLQLFLNETRDLKVILDLLNACSHICSACRKQSFLLFLLKDNSKMQVSANSSVSSTAPNTISSPGHGRFCSVWKKKKIQMWVGINAYLLRDRKI